MMEVDVPFGLEPCFGLDGLFRRGGSLVWRRRRLTRIEMFVQCRLYGWGTLTDDIDDCLGYTPSLSTDISMP